MWVPWLETHGFWGWGPFGPPKSFGPPTYKYTCSGPRIFVWTTTFGRAGAPGPPQKYRVSSPGVRSQFVLKHSIQVSILFGNIYIFHLYDTCFYASLRNWSQTWFVSCRWMTLSLIPRSNLYIQQVHIRGRLYFLYCSFILSIYKSNYVEKYTHLFRKEKFMYMYSVYRVKLL